MKYTEDSTAPVIAIDGPSASGKGTIAQRVTRALGFVYLDSGAIYRALALAAIEKNIDKTNSAALVELAGQLNLCFKNGLTLSDGVDISEKIRFPEISLFASSVATIQSVREALLMKQRAFRQLPGLVADGRDMGTVVFKDARLKIFLIASVEIRAERRVVQLKQQGVDACYEDILSDLNNRDARDRNRQASPLFRAEDAICLDSSDQSIEACVSFVLEKWQENQ